MDSPSSAQVFDPICGMWLEPAQVAATCTYIGQTYGFCSTECRNLFARTPDIHVLRLAHDPESCIAHACPLQRYEIGTSDERAPSRCRISCIQ